MPAKKTLVVTQTGLLIALVVLVQYLGSALIPASPGNLTRQLVTGSLINLILILSAALVRMVPAIVVGVTSAVLSQILGIAGFPLFLPAIMLGNIAIVIVMSLVFELAKEKRPGRRNALLCAGVATGAVIKCGVIWSLVQCILLPAIEKTTPAKALTAYSLSFSWPQAITAAIGGILALTILPLLYKSEKPR